MLEYIELKPSGKPRAVMVWLHGLGADGYDLEPVADMLGLAGMHHILPHAPVRPVTLNNGLSMRAWYDIAGTDLRWREDSRGMIESARQVQTLIAHWRKTTGIPVLLAGFSQGAVISLMTAALGVEGLMGVAALSGYVPQALTAEPDVSESISVPGFFENLPVPGSFENLPVFMAHGQQDDIIPFALAQHGREVLSGLGARLDWHTYAMPHTICQEEITALSGWLETWLNSTR